ncbi:NAD(P)-dependent oxidoreductase [Aestuariivirga litoralis]|uniref:NAD(P)-dependent oxidoreductase n=1 Tax=Aestuariivirga litoralis TaxID=2650924 RepID=UPI0018C764F7|nr:NAD(P)-dependent oxidoreductase [Aestuariivirga litoralis]MBG1233413.1 NAD(P)-dependent oxidoreductase [Aestuariivirga litoralis]
MSIKSVGLIGPGLMGHGIGKNIVTKGFALTVLARKNRAPIESLKSFGAQEAASMADLVKASDMLILCVTGSPQIEEIMLGEGGLLANAKKGLIIADCSTAEPHSTIKLAAAAAEKGMHYVDTPMTRTPKEAEAGKLGLMVGGDAAILDKIDPVLKCFSDLIVRTGAVGTAHQVKLINNFLSLSHAAIAAEAITVAAKANVNMESLREVIMGGGGASVMFGRLINVPLSDDDSHAKFAIRNARKDLRYYTNMTENMPVASYLAEQVHQTYVLADTLGFGERYVPRLITMMMQNAGLAKK